MALVEITSTNTTNLVNADRALDNEELDAEKQAESFPVAKFPRIKPVHGTLGYAFRNIKGRNHVVMEALKYVSGGNGYHTGRHKFVKNFIILWRNMDQYSKDRLDIFDILCEKYGINKAKFFGVVQEGMFIFNDLMAETALSGFSEEFVELIKRFARKEKNFKDRELFAKMTNKIKDAPLIGAINDNSVKQELHVHNENNGGVPSFATTMRRSDEGIRTPITTQSQKVLTEGKQDYIDAEIISETGTKKENGELVPLSIEEEFERSILELNGQKG